MGSSNFRHGEAGSLSLSDKGKRRNCTENKEEVDHR